MRILIILKYCFLGDAIVSLPLIKGVHRQWPGAELTVLSCKGAKIILSLDPDLDGVNVVPYGPNSTLRNAKNSRKITADSFRFAWKERRKGGFDIIFLVHRSFRTGLTAMLCKGRRRVGFKHDGRGFMLTDHILFDKYKQESESTLGLLQLLAPDFDGQPWPNRPVLNFDPKRIPLTPDFPPPGTGPLIGMQPGASNVPKRWPLDRMAALADALIERHQARIVLIGGPDEREPADIMLKHMKHPVAFDATGERFPETIGMMARLTAYIGNDTGLNHLAAAVGSPTVCLFGPTVAQKWGRHYEPHRVVVSRDGTMEGLPLEDALSAAENLIGAAAKGPV